MLFYLFILTIIILCILAQPYANRSIQEGFTRKFFNQIIPTYFFGLNQIELMGNTYEVIKLIRPMIPYNLDTLVINQSIEAYTNLNQNKIQFMMAPTHVLHNIIYKTQPKLANLEIPNLRVVASMYRLPINILTSDLKINEFGDLKGSGISVNVGQRYSGDYFIAQDLLLAYNLVVGRDVKLTYYEYPEILKHYGQDVGVVIYTCTHPDIMISQLTNQQTSRIVQINKYNNGDIFGISLDETQFYKDHSYYHKTVLEKEFLHNYYPNLVLDAREFNPDVEQPLVTNNLSRYLNTIGIHYYLLSNRQTPNSIIGQFLYNLKINIDEINKLPFIDEKIDSVSMVNFVLPMPVHEGARDFYFRSGLYTYIDNPACVMLDGKCTMEQLYDHRMLRDFGKTFDEIYNTDPKIPKYLTKK